MQDYRVAVVAPPWYPVPPVGYGGIELVVDLLVTGLKNRGVDVVLYAAEGSRSDAIALAPASWSKDLAGIRCLARRYARAVGYSQYQGSLTTWPKQTYAVARGLRRQGLNDAAAALETRLLNAVNIADGYPEFFYLDHRGHVVYRPVAVTKAAGPSTPPSPGTIAGTNLPDATQTWTVSAVLAIKWHVGHSRPGYQVARTPEIAAIRRQLKPRPVDRKLGERHERELLRRSGLSDRIWLGAKADGIQQL